jgi:ribosomal protein S18 acetylase RimI-like enzyme
MTVAGALEIAMLPSAAADDVQLIAVLTSLINDVYAVAEEGLWAQGTSRTSAEEISGIVRAGQMAVARVDGQIVGCVRIQLLDGSIGEFGMLAVVPSHRGVGVGGELVRFAEQAVRTQRFETMQLEVLVPRDWSHPSKEFISSWYARIGYRPVRVGAIEETYPELAPFLATPCDFVIYRRALGAYEQSPQLD